MYQSSIELLISHGYKRESIEVIRAHAKLLRTFAHDCHNQEAKHDYLIQVTFYFFIICLIFLRNNLFFFSFK